MRSDFCKWLLFCVCGSGCYSVFVKWLLFCVCGSGCYSVFVQVVVILCLWNLYLRSDFCKWLLFCVCGIYICKSRKIAAFYQCLEKKTSKTAGKFAKMNPVKIKATKFFSYKYYFP